jgi:hypothetical protein
MTLGCREGSSATEFFSGAIAELWVANIDVQADGATIVPATMHALRLYGPFARPSLAASLVEYRSLRKHVLAGDGRDLIAGAGARLQAWQNVNGATLGPHPPLPYGYVNPRQTRRPLPI